MEKLVNQVPQGLWESWVSQKPGSTPNLATNSQMILIRKRRNSPREESRSLQQQGLLFKATRLDTYPLTEQGVGTQVSVMSGPKSRDASSKIAKKSGLLGHKRAGGKLQSIQAPHAPELPGQGVLAARATDQPSLTWMSSPCPRA